MKKICGLIVLILIYCGSYVLIADEDTDVKAKLKSIIIDRIEFENLPVTKAVMKLQEYSVAKDPEKKGVKITLMLPQTEAFKTPSVTIFTTDLTLQAALEQVCSMADLKYSIDGDRVVIKGTVATGFKKTKVGSENSDTGRVVSTEEKGSSRSSGGTSSSSLKSSKNKSKSGGSSLIPAASDNEQTYIKDAQKTADVSSRVMPSLVIIEGKKGRGSGFVAKISGKKMLVTNIHVIFDNNGLDFRDINNNKIAFKSVFLAKERDILLAEIDESLCAPPPALDLEKDIVAEPIGSEVIACGNSQGSGVNTALAGNLMGIGSRTIEISAKFVPGNSGCPIISTKSGKVIGVVTYASIKVGSLAELDSRFAFAVRRFGTRIDNIPSEELQAFDYDKYKKDLAVFHGIQDACRGSLFMLKDMYVGHGGKGFPAIPINTDNFKDLPVLAKLIEPLNARAEDFMKAKKMELGGGQENKGKMGASSLNKSKNIAVDIKAQLVKIRGQFNSVLSEYEKEKPYYAYVDKISSDYVELLKKLLEKYDEWLKKYDAAVTASESSYKGK